MTDDEIMTQLLAYARKKMENNNAYPFASFVVKNGEIVSRAYNKRINLYGDKTTHGEMEAISEVNRSLKQKKLVVLDEGYTLYSSCEPCLACFDAALWANIKTFVFSVDHHDFPDYFHDHPYSIENYEKDNPGDISVTRHVLHEEGLKIFADAKKKYGW